MTKDVNLKEMVDFIKIHVAEEVAMEISEIDENSSFVNLGLDSISGIFILDKIEQKYGVDLSPILLLDYPTINKFSEFLISEINKDE